MRRLCGEENATVRTVRLRGGPLWRNINYPREGQAGWRDLKYGCGFDSHCANYR